MINFLVTTNIADLPEGAIAMVDGTVPGWVAGPNDLHYDHHRPGGADVQIMEMPDKVVMPNDCTIVTTQVDADACAAAAWLILKQMALDPAVEYQAYCDLVAIAYDCDHLGLPSEPKWNPYREFARNAVASLKLSGEKVISDLGLDPDRKNWSADQKRNYASVCFRRGTDALVWGALGKEPYPGIFGEAREYWERVEGLRPYVNACSRLIDGCAVLDQRSLPHYCDPRLLVEWARTVDAGNITLTVRDRTLEFVAVEKGCAFRNELPDYELQEWEEIAMEFAVPAYSYTLGSVPLHKDGSPKFSDRGVWQALAAAERQKREDYGYPMPSSDWGGRNEVGGSSWNDACVLSPEEVISIVKQVG